MKSMNSYFTQSELALAAYATFKTEMTEAEYIRALQQGDDGLSSLQAQNFASRYTVVAQYDGVVEETYVDEFGDERTVLVSTGLSATVFEEFGTGKRYLAIRGTNNPNDVATDIIDIAVLGTPERQAQYAALKDQVAAWLADGTLASGFTVAGHSLGGFLAGALLVDYPTEIDHAYLYNAPGVGGLSAGLRLLAGLETEPTLDLSKVSNLIAAAGPSVTAGLGLDWGTPVPVFIEDQSPNIFGNHSIKHLTDALAVQSLLGALSATANTGDLNEILSAATHQTAMTLESVVNALGELFQAGTDDWKLAA